MQTIFKCFYGSHLYGVSKPESDKDFKGVFVFSLDELIRSHPQNVQWKDEETNEEHEMYYVKRFADLLASGQTVAYSMLFAPEDMWLQATPAWETLVANKDKVVSKALKPFVGYARTQASKYSFKGSKLQTLLEFQATVSQLGRMVTPTGALLAWDFDSLKTRFGGRDGVRLWVESRCNVPVDMIEVCGKSFGATTPLKLWLPVLDKMVSHYGSRASSAMANQGTDLKALYHSVRICSEMNEILKDGKVTYPRPERELLLDIRNGRLSNGEIGAIIDTLMDEGEDLMLTSTLRELPDYQFIEDWYVSVQKKYIGLLG